MSRYKEGDIIKGKTMTLIVKRMPEGESYCTEVCALSTGKRTCSMYQLCKELGIKLTTCKELIGFCYLKEIKGGV